MWHPFKIEKTYHSPKSIEAITAIIQRKITDNKRSILPPPYYGQINENSFSITKRFFGKSSVSVKMEGKMMEAKTATCITVKFTTAYHILYMPAMILLLLLLVNSDAKTFTINHIETSRFVSLLFSVALFMLSIIIVASIAFSALDTERRILEKELKLTPSYKSSL